MGKPVSDYHKRVLRERSLASMPCTITQIVNACGYSHGTVAEALDLLLLQGVAKKTAAAKQRNNVYERLPHVSAPDVEPYVLGESRWKGRAEAKPRNGSKGSGVIAGPSYATGFRWRSAADNFL